MHPISFSTAQTPVGTMLALHTPAGLIALERIEAPLGVALGTWHLRLGENIVPAGGEEAELHTQLAEYFARTRTSFDLLLDWRLTTGFTERALRFITTIPYGHTASYGEVAAGAGSPRAHRAVGTACAHTPFSVVVPVHRVIRADGSPGEYGAHPEIKRFLLDFEAHTDPRV